MQKGLGKPNRALHSPLLLGRPCLPFASLQALKTLKIPRGSFHQALWPQAFAVPALQPAVCLRSPLLLRRSSLLFASLQTIKTLKTIKIPRGSFHQALWPQAFAVPALQPAVCLHSPLLLGRSSLLFASLQTLKKPLKPSKSPAVASTKPSSLQSLKTIKMLTIPAAASTKHSGHKPLLFQRCSLQFACIALCC